MEEVNRLIEAAHGRKLGTEFEIALIKARRTAFVARFIVLREGRRTKAHRKIELMTWDELTSAEELALMFRQTFIENGDNLVRVDRDIKRALQHANRSLVHFVHEYSTRSTTSFLDALIDYEKSNGLLFDENDSPRLGGWLLPKEIKRNIENK